MVVRFLYEPFPVESSLADQVPIPSVTILCAYHQKAQQPDPSYLHQAPVLMFSCAPVLRMSPVSMSDGWQVRLYCNHSPKRPSTNLNILCFMSNG